MKRDPLTGRMVTPQRIEETTWPRAIPDDVARELARREPESPSTWQVRSLLRAALIRLLWREVADGGGCVCEEGAVPAGEETEWDQELTDTCQAMRALGWGQHWDATEFQRRAMREASAASARQRPQGVP